MSTKKKAYSVGLAEVQFGQASRIGFMPNAMSKIGKVYQDTCKVTQDAPDVTEHFEEGNPVPIIRTTTKKPPKVSFSIVVEDLETLERLIGGKASDSEWAEGQNFAANLAIRVISKQGMMINIPNASISGSFDWELSDKGLMKIAVEAVPQDVDTRKPFVTTMLADKLKLDKDVVEIPANGGNATVSISSGKGSTTTAMALGEGTSWLTVTIESGNVKVSASNNTSADRSAVVQVISGSSTATFTVVQRKA